MLQYDVLIIGSGVAGMTAAIYLKRAGINCCLIEKSAPGGQVNNTSLVENYPGFTGTGLELSMKIYEQIQNLEVPYRYGNIIEVIDYNDYKVVKTDVEEICCKGIIFAQGRSPRKLGIPLEDKLSGAGISWCAVCDGPIYKGKDVLIIGGGNSAVEEALYLSEICKKVTIIHRRDELTAQTYLIEKVKQKRNVKILLDTEALEFCEKENRLDSVIVIEHKKNKKKKLKVQGCFIYIGQIPNTKEIENLSILDQNGYIITDQNRRTTIPFIYAAGDVIKKDFYQIVTATSDGAIAANSFIKDMTEK